MVSGQLKIMGAHEGAESRFPEKCVLLWTAIHGETKKNLVHLIQLQAFSLKVGKTSPFVRFEKLAENLQDQIWQL